MKKVSILLCAVLLSGCKDPLEAARNAEDPSEKIRLYQKVKTLPEEDAVNLHELYMQQYPSYIEQDSKLTGNTILKLQTDPSLHSEEGITADEDGNIVALPEGVELTYTEGKVSSVSLDGMLIHDGFDFSKEGTQYTVNLHTDTLPAWKKEVYQDGNLIETDDSENGLIKYSYHDNGNGRILEESQWHMKDDSTYTWKYTYEEGVCTSKNLFSRLKSTGTYKSYVYDEEGRVQMETQYSNLIHQDYSKTYTYSYGTHLKAVTTQTEKNTVTIQYDLYEETAVIINEKNEEIGKGYHIPAFGWIYIYD